MKQSLIEKLTHIVDRQQEVGQLLSQPDVIADQNKFRDLSKEYAQLEPIVNCFNAYQQAIQTADNTRELLHDEDPALQELAAAELDEAKQQIFTLEDSLHRLLLPRDPSDDKNVFLEIRAGTGGAEAAIFAGDLFRMYARYAEVKNWQMQIVSESLGDYGGYKEVIARISGDQVYSRLKFESGAHRVQRVPETESQGRIHTSACTVAVLPEAEEIDEVDVQQSDLRIDTFRASGAGGQHVNRTDSAVRITHLSSGIVVECQDERSQHQNRARAMSLLRAKLLSAEREKQRNERAETRRNLVGSGDRSERIRTYNFPQNRMTDHRINLTLYKLDKIMEGELDQVIDPLIQEHQADLMCEMVE